MTYCALRLLVAVVLPKWPAAVTASAASWWPDAWLGAAMLLSTPPPPSAPPVGEATWAAPAGQVVEPVATPSQYCVMTPDQVSLLVPMPLNSRCSRGASPLLSPVSVMSVLAFVPAVPHCVP